VRHILDIIKELKVARRLVLPVLSKIGRRDTTISHHYTGDMLRLNCFKHRNYWFMGRRREEDTIALIEKIVRPGDTCFDVGANIGYISLILARIADAGGRVFAFEPDPNNLGPIFVVEVHQHPENQRSVFDCLDEAGYRIFDVSTLLTLYKPQQLRANVLCLRPDLHAEILERLHHATGSTVR